jgi:FtsP/CotA-like multicopper oxidase with cupredoxin domain
MLSVTPLRAIGGVLVALSTVVSCSDNVQKQKSPEFLNAFQLPLTIPAIKEPLTTYINPDNGVPIDYYELEAKESQHSFYPNLGNASIFGFDGTFMGPTFRVQKGHESVVRLINKSTRKTNLHLHGSFCKLCSTKKVVKLTGTARSRKQRERFVSLSNLGSIRWLGNGRTQPG